MVNIPSLVEEIVVDIIFFNILKLLLILYILFDDDDGISIGRFVVGWDDVVSSQFIIFLNILLFL